MIKHGSVKKADVSQLTYPIQLKTICSISETVRLFSHTTHTFVMLPLKGFARVLIA